MSAKNITTENAPSASSLGMTGPSSAVGKARPDKSPVMDLDPEVTAPMSGKLTPGKEVIKKFSASGGPGKKK